MTRTIRPAGTTDSPEGQRDFALGALAAAGHAIDDDMSNALLDRLTGGEIDFETFKRLAIEHHHAK